MATGEKVSETIGNRCVSEGGSSSQPSSSPHRSCHRLAMFQRRRRRRQTGKVGKVRDEGFNEGGTVATGGKLEKLGKLEMLEKLEKLDKLENEKT